MTTTIGIIGLGQIGASIGLGIKKRASGERILGYSRRASQGKAAQDLGAVDQAVSLKTAAREADILFLCLPLAAMRSALEDLAMHRRETGVLIDTAPLRRPVNEWVDELLPASAQHIGLIPSLGPSAVAGSDWGQDAARDDLFRRGTMLIVSSPRSTEAIEDLALHIARVLGASPLLTDAAEADGLMTTAHFLPQLAASALMEASVGTAGWKEARRIAGRPLATVTGGIAHFDDPASVEIAISSNPPRVVHGLDVLIAALQGLRQDLSKNDAERVSQRLMHSYKARESWLDERNEADWASDGSELKDLPGLGEHFTRLLFGGRIAEAVRGQPPKSATDG